MTFDPRIPTAEQSPRDCTDQFRDNINTYPVAFAINHVALSNSNQGKHQAVIQKKQLVDPNVRGDWSTLFCKDVASAAFGTQPELFVRIPRFINKRIGHDPMQLTYPQVVLAPAGADPYQSFLPGGFVFYTAVIANFGGAAAASTQITLAPAPTSIVAVVAQPNRLGQFGATFSPVLVTVRVDNATQFTVFRSARGTAVVPISYIAIGRA